MSKWTPGPWIVDDGDSEVVGVFSDDDQNAICYLSEDIVHGLRGIETDTANARLIAAAPELATALQAMLGKFGRDLQNAGVIFQAEAALRKAGVE